jgi:23S rRNA (adenine-N6)-dimethyltransferase
VETLRSSNRRSVALSQNFLRDPRLIDHLLRRSSIGPTDLVVEIGPGGGAITRRLAERCGRLLAIERDPRLAADLRRRFAGRDHVRIVEADVLDASLPTGEYKVFANIPFNVTTAIVAKLTSGQDPPRDAYLAVQREAAARFLGEPRGTLVALLLAPWFESSIFHRFRRQDFSPVPRVDVVMLRLRRRERPLVAPDDTRFFRDFAVFAFTAWQPSLRDVLARLLSGTDTAAIERQAGTCLSRPPSALAVPEWLDVFRAVRDRADRRASRQILGAEARLRRQQAGLEKEHRTRVVQSRNR